MATEVSRSRVLRIDDLAEPGEKVWTAFCRMADGREEEVDLVAEDRIEARELAEAEVGPRGSVRAVQLRFGRFL